MIGICLETAKNTKAFECFFIGFHWKFSTTGNLYSLKSWLWLAVVACVVRWPISNALLNDIWLACFTRMYNWNYWHKHRGFMVISILGHFDLGKLAPFHWSSLRLLAPGWTKSCFIPTPSSPRLDETLFPKTCWAQKHPKMSRDMTKPTIWHVRPAKTQISLGIRPVWSESSLSAWRKLGS